MKILLSYIVTDGVMGRFKRTLELQRLFPEAVKSLDIIVVTDMDSVIPGEMKVIRAPLWQSGALNFCKAMNVAIDYATENGYDWWLAANADRVILSRPDQMPTPGLGCAQECYESTSDRFEAIHERWSKGKVTFSGGSSFFVVHRSVFTKHRFCEEYLGWGYEDNDYTDNICTPNGVPACQWTPPNNGMKSVCLWHSQKERESWTCEERNRILYEKRREASKPRHRVFVYHGTNNLGDMVQAIALSRLLPRAIGVFRDAPEMDPRGNELLVASGYIHPKAASRQSNVLFSGICLTDALEAHLNWVRGSTFPVGSRDPETHKLVTAMGMKSELIGCATLTLPRYDGPRSGVYAIDCGEEGLPITHAIHNGMSVDQQWGKATRCLNAYRTAERIHTSRIHALLPCLAFGTPVRYVGPVDKRTSILKEIGVPHGKLFTMDVSKWREQFMEFLGRNVGKGLVSDGEIKMPVIIKDYPK